ncbi:MAG: hypothetical protein AB7V77_05215 [Candidatus Woesearchaeota archaeon]
MIENAGTQKICPLCGDSLKKVTSNKGRNYIKCKSNGFMEDGKATTCEFMFDTRPKILEKQRIGELTQAEIISILNGDKVIKGAGFFYIDGRPDIVEDKRFWLHYDFKEAIVQDF